MYHAHLIQRGERKSLVWIACDLLIALGMGWIVLGLGSWFELGLSTTQSLAIMAGWAGPQIIDQVIAAAIERARTADKKDDSASKP
jgi:hypothetical protein